MIAVRKDLYPTVISWLIYVCNENLLVFDGGMLTVEGYSWRSISSGTLVMSHFKNKVWMPELERGTLKNFPYTSVCSKMDATSPLTISPLSSQKIYFSDIKLCSEYEKRFRDPICCDFWSTSLNITSFIGWSVWTGWWFFVYFVHKCDWFLNILFI